MRIVYTAGIFDLLHEGHINALKASRAHGDRLVVGVVSDEGAMAYKRQPIQDERTRLLVVQSLYFVDLAVIQPTTDPTPVLEVIRPQVMTHGDDWQRLIKGQSTLERLGIEWVLVPYTHGVSTTQTIRRMEG